MCKKAETTQDLKAALRKGAKPEAGEDRGVMTVVVMAASTRPASSSLREEDRFRDILE